MAGEGGALLTDARSSFSESALFLMDGEDSGSGGGLQSHSTPHTHMPTSHATHSAHLGGVATLSGWSRSLPNLIRFTSTSNARVALAGTWPGTPLLPYPRCGGITRRRLPALPIPTMPSSHPLITLPLPTLNLKVLSELALLSNVCRRRGKHYTAPPPAPHTPPLTDPKAPSWKR